MIDNTLIDRPEVGLDGGTSMAQLKSLCGHEQTNQWGVSVQLPVDTWFQLYILKRQWIWFRDIWNY